MEEGAHTTDTEDTLGGVGAIVLPTEPPAQPATTSSKGAASTHPSRLFNFPVPTVILRAPTFLDEITPGAPFPHHTRTCTLMPTGAPASTSPPKKSSFWSLLQALSGLCAKESQTRYPTPMSTDATRLNVIITGATGMVGEGVLLTCLEHPAIARVLLVSRKPYGMQHPKLTECIVPDFMHLDTVRDQLTGYDACFFCAGISSAGMSEGDYTHITYDITLHFASALASLSPRMVFCYVSGALTDSTEKGRMMWARVKGRTENALTRLGFRSVYNFRPGFMRATPGQRNIKSYYKLIEWAYPLLHTLLPNQVSTLHDVGIAMIRCVQQGYPKQTLEIKDINTLAKS